MLPVLPQRRRVAGAVLAAIFFVGYFAGSCTYLHGIDPITPAKSARNTSGNGRELETDPEDADEQQYVVDEAPRNNTSPPPHSLPSSPIPPASLVTEAAGRRDSHIEAIVVFTMVRFDLLELHLKSIDYPTKHVFVLFNYANDNTKQQTLAMLNKFGRVHFFHAVTGLPERDIRLNTITAVQIE